MTTAAPTDEELALVAEVAIREGWADLGTPPERHGARTLAEQAAVARFQAAIPKAPRNPRAMRIRARLSIVALAIAVLGVCWWVSPARTAIGLVGAGLFSLVAMRRGRRRGARPLVR